jgi:hypothetical protein
MRVTFGTIVPIVRNPGCQTLLSVEQRAKQAQTEMKDPHGSAEGSHLLDVRKFDDTLPWDKVPHILLNGMQHWHMQNISPVRSGVEDDIRKRVRAAAEDSTTDMSMVLPVFTNAVMPVERQNGESLEALKIRLSKQYRFGGSVQMVETRTLDTGLPEELLERVPVIVVTGRLAEMADAANQGDTGARKYMALEVRDLLQPAK